MARVRGDTDTRLERRLASFLWREGTRDYRRRCKEHQGRPDFCFHTARVAVFVDGCFWHWCPVHFKLPATRVDFWKKKLSANRIRDRRQTRQFRESGWTVIRIWNHDIKTEAGTHRAITRIIRALRMRTASTTA
jgi:DNA mismatch endonuclease (patch repair protein)